MPETASTPPLTPPASVARWLQWGEAQLSGRVDRPRLEAQILLASAIKRDRLWLMAHPEAAIDPGSYPDWIAQRADAQPLEYLTGRVGFYSREFIITPGVLIPRPETELLIDRALAAIATSQAPRIAEIGTGSGVIAIVLALLRTDAEIVATDINPKAIALARENAALHGVADRIAFVQGSLLDGVGGPFDLLISNPPYIASDAPLDPCVLKEPYEALFGGAAGHELLFQIIDSACAQRVGYLACECGYDQRAVLERYLADKRVSEVEFYQDYAQLQRGFVARIDD